jgi:hypothetical protein
MVIKELEPFLEGLEERVELLNDLGNEVAQTDPEGAEDIFKIVDLLDKLIYLKSEGLL